MEIKIFARQGSDGECSLGDALALVTVLVLLKMPFLSSSTRPK